jgi:hypothetical protein
MITIDMFSCQADCKFEMSNCCSGEERFGLLRIDCDMLLLLAEGLKYS